jgi:hypothetical protein
VSSPIIALDHLRIAVADLDGEVANYRSLLDREPLWEGEADRRRSAVFGTGNVALLLQEDTGTTGLAGVRFRVDDLERLRRRLQRVGIDCSDAVDPLAVRDGKAAQPMVVPAAMQCRGLALGFVARAAATQAEASDDGAAVTGLDHVVIASANAEATAFTLAAQLGMDMRMDISRPEWDARLMFYRCGDLIVEVFQKLSGEAPSPGDSLYGVSWRIADADAARARLLDRGFDVSEVRSGRRPDTRVLTVRSRTAGVATLLIEHKPA